jgi:hypothetical protein
VEADGAEPADDGFPLGCEAALVEVWLQGYDGSQPLVDIGGVENVVLPYWSGAIADVGEPVSRERGSDRPQPGFYRPGNGPGAPQLAEGRGVIDAGDGLAAGG